MDMWATQPTLDLAREEKVPALLVINRVPPRAKLADDLIERIKTMGSNSGATVAQTHIGNRIQFAAALFEGRSVTESAKRTRAAEEIQELAAEILNRG
jgi:chromosome partitioning protein